MSKPTIFWPGAKNSNGGCEISEPTTKVAPSAGTPAMRVDTNKASWSTRKKRELIGVRYEARSRSACSSGHGSVRLRVATTMAIRGIVWIKARLAASLLAVVGALAVAAPAYADEQPTCRGPLSTSETAFVQSVQSDLMARFSHASDALAAGYVRYTAPDDTGAI